MVVKIMCAHMLNPQLNDKAKDFLARNIGPMEMEKLPNGDLYCPCGFTIKASIEPAKS